MLKRMRIRHKLDKRAELGDVVRDGEKTYVVINIIKAHVFVDANGEISAIYDCLCQQYRSENLSEEFVTTQTELPYGRGEWDEIADVGNIIYDTETGIYVSIERIAGIRFEGETMYVTYEFSPVPEWSDYEMDEAVLKYRHRFMHLVRHDEKRTQEQKPS